MTHRTPIQQHVDAVTPEAETIAAAVECLHAGQIVAYPTDTLYGLAVDTRNAVAVDRLFTVKGRPAHLAIPLIAADVNQVSRIGQLTGAGRDLAERFWPGPLTLVVESAPDLSPRLRGGRESIAVRIPDHAVARALASRLGAPITATSANRSGEPPAVSADEVAEMLGADVAMILDAGPSVDGPPSTIVDVREPRPRLLRAGRVPWDRVLQSLS